MPISRIKTDGIQDDAVTSAKIGVNVIVADDLAANSVTVSEITNGAVTSAKLDTNIAVTGTLSAGGALTSTGEFKANGGVVFNEDSLDVDFRVESNNNANMLVVDAGNDTVGIGTDSPSTVLDVEGSNINFGTGENGILNVFSDDAAATDKGGSISLGGNSDSGALGFALIKGAKEGTDSGYLAFGTRTAAAYSTERMRIDSSGNVVMLNHASIGVNAPASTRALTVAGATDGSGSTILQLYNSSLASKFSVRDDGFISASRGAVGALATFTDGIATNFTLKTDGSNVGTFGTEAGGTQLAFMVSNSEKMRIDNSGNVGIAENSSIDGRLHINSTGQNNASGINILLECTSGGGRQWAHRISETGVNNGWYVIRDQTADKTRIQIHENGYFMINPINEQTHVRIGTTGAIGTGYAGFELVRTSDNYGVMNIGKTYSGNAAAVNFWYSASKVGSITYSNSATAYNTSSDYRLKENVEYDFDATTRLKQLKPARFNFIEDADTTVDGFLAHEVQSIVPEAITGTHNEVDDEGNPIYQGIDQGKLVPLLVKTIQELEARITALESN